MPPDPSDRGSLPDQSVFDRDPCDGCDGACGDVCPVFEAKRLNTERSVMGDPIEAWKARGRELTEIYDALTTIVEEPAPGMDPVADLKALGAQRDRLRAEVTHLKEEQVSLVGSLGDAQAEVERLREALEKIKAECGRVCPGFELCDHRSCASSYSAWAYADEALSGPASDDEHRAPEGIDGARRFDLAGQPLCFSCGKTQSEHEGGIECARPSRETEQAK